MKPFRRLPRLLAAALLLGAALWTCGAAQAQTNSQQAIEAARKYRAEQRAQPERPDLQRPYRSSADPTADPNASLHSCLDHAGMNVVARDHCMRQHCHGRWGQGDCPASRGNLLAPAGASSNTPLGRCLAQAGRNPFKRNACGWEFCRGASMAQWKQTPECAELSGAGATPLAN